MSASMNPSTPPDTALTMILLIVFMLPPQMREPRPYTLFRPSRI